MIKIIMVLVYGSLALMALCQYENWLNSLPQLYSGLIGISAGTVCALLAVATDLAIYFRLFKF